MNSGLQNLVAMSMCQHEALKAAISLEELWQLRFRQENKKYNCFICICTTLKHLSVSEKSNIKV